MKRAITGAITLVGLVLVILSVMGVILLGSNGTWHSELKVPAGRTAVVVQPALASVLGPRITVRAEADAASDQQVPLFIGRARPDDASALVESSDRLLVSGLDGARQLSTVHRNGNDPFPVPDTVDVWQSQATGTGAVEIAYRARPGAETVVIARADGKPLPAMTLHLGWTRAVWFWIPVALLLAGLGLLLLGRRLRAPTRPRRIPVAVATRPQSPPSAGRRGRSSTNQHVGRRRATPANGSRR
ncbi:hypothetical protein [Angustibacter luteus]|uniref:DUF3068 domain-containing protein n=1 Tax=Angustibacter luteus TaxID=658456 RepID=A0ABW1JIS2_9ACTN